VNLFLLHFRENTVVMVSVVY